MAKLSNLVAYFRACYQVDFRATRVLNFNDGKIQQQLVLKSSELLTGQWTQYPIDSKWGEAVEKKLSIHGREIGLYAGSFFVFGKMSVLGKTKKIACPLFLHPVNLIIENDIYYLSLDTDNGLVNPAFIEFIRSMFAEIDITYDQLNGILPTGYIGFEELHQIEESFQTFLPEIVINSIADFPKIIDASKFDSLARKRWKPKEVELIPAICVGLITKPSGSRGILNELSKMVEHDDFAQPIKSLLLDHEVRKRVPSKRPVYSPVDLSENQIAVLKGVDTNDINMVVGPPGTGKSFTIAAIAVDAIRRGQSVLIASRSEQAGKVIAKKIENDFGLKGIAIRTASKVYKNLLKKRLNNVLHGFGSSKVTAEDLYRLEKELNLIQLEAERLEKLLSLREKDEIKWGTFFKNYQGSFFQKIRMAFTTYQIDLKEPIWKTMDFLEKKLVQVKLKTKNLIRKEFEYHLNSALEHGRNSIQNLLYAVEEKSGNLAHDFFEAANFNVILQALPIWIVSSAEVHKSLPLKKELFDIVIFDEATQCDISSSLPLLQRAKKAVVVGDPKQLRHISFLSKKQQNLFAKKYQINHVLQSKTNYRKQSLLDLASASIKSQKQVFLLDEHFRSLPQIIAFSNQTFYEDRLKVMTATPITINERCVHHQVVNGSRNTKGFNEVEAESIIAHVKQIIHSEKGLKRSLCQSIGILSPFRNQVTYLRKLIFSQFDQTQIRRHQLLVGTAHQFQGEERDIMFLSFVVDTNTHPSTYIFLNKPDIFNVSITRARSAQFVYTSIPINQLPTTHLLNNYLMQIGTRNLEPVESDEYNYHDEFLHDVIEQIKSWGIHQYYLNYPIAGIEIDIVIVLDGTTYCIDLIGYPGDFESLIPMERWGLLNRVGAKMFPLPFSIWYLYKKTASKALRKWLKVKKPTP